MDNLDEKAKLFVAKRADGMPDEMSLYAHIAADFAREQIAPYQSRIEKLEKALELAKRALEQYAKPTESHILAEMTLVEIAREALKD